MHAVNMIVVPCINVKANKQTRDLNKIAYSSFEMKALLFRAVKRRMRKSVYLHTFRSTTTFGVGSDASNGSRRSCGRKMHMQHSSRRIIERTHPNRTSMLLLWNTPRFSKSFVLWTRAKIQHDRGPCISEGLVN